MYFAFANKRACIFHIMAVFELGRKTYWSIDKFDEIKIQRNCIAALQSGLCRLLCRVKQIITRISSKIKLLDCLRIWGNETSLQLLHKHFSLTKTCVFFFPRSYSLKNVDFDTQLGCARFLNLSSCFNTFDYSNNSKITRYPIILLKDMLTIHFNAWS